jgi:chemotaxis protein methyltransferase CheR
LIKNKEVAVDDQQFARLLGYFDYSWHGYRKVRKGVKKRVSRHMQELGCRNIDAYIEQISSDREALAACKRRMTVPISRFFRDLRLWEILWDRVLPELAGKKRVKERIDIWFAGCAGGEEVYSFKILWEEFRGEHEVPDLGVIATDVNPDHLKRAQNAIYTRGSLREVSRKREEKWFDRVKNEHFSVGQNLKEKITWQVHDLLADEAPGRFHVVFLRNNLLTYYDKQSIMVPLARVIAAMHDGGFLIIGSKESMPDIEGVRPYDRYIYQKKR